MKYFTSNVYTIAQKKILSQNVVKMTFDNFKFNTYKNCMRIIEVFVDFKNDEIYLG
jgi:hypothetical protein